MNKFQFRVWDKDSKTFVKNPVLSSKHVETDGLFIVSNDRFTVQIATGKTAKKDKIIFQGDVIKLNNKSEHTLKAYWFPIFEVTWDGFEFGLKHLGGGKCGDGHMFGFRYRSNEFEIIGNVFESTIIIPK